MIVTSNRNVKKFDKQFAKAGKKLLNKISVSMYLKTFGTYQSNINALEGRKSLIVTSNDFLNISSRKTIVDTLKEIHFERKDDKWTTKTAIAFLDEVMNLFLFEGDDDIIKLTSDEISKRYNVPVSRLKTQTALFINNLYSGIDKYGIYNYFSKYEIVRWKYRDINKLQSDVENNKLLDDDRKILEELEII